MLPVLRAKTLEGIEDAGRWASQMVEECREALKVIVPFADSEREFLHCLLDLGEIKAELLTSDSAAQGN